MTGRSLICKPFLLALFLVLLALPATVSAMPWSWDLFEQISEQAQESPALATPKGTIPFGGKLSYTTDRASAQKLVNPAEPTKASLERGKYKYDTYCATCHGASGKGDGPVGKKFVPPTDLTGAYVQDKTGGDIYYTITKGGMFIMPPYDDSMDQIDRWHIVNYIKNVFGGDSAATR
jgi:mono/diheme cytochrome c family protein